MVSQAYAGIRITAVRQAGRMMYLMLSGMRHTHVVYSLYRCYRYVMDPACVLFGWWRSYSFFAAIRVTWPYIRVRDAVYDGYDQNMG